MLKRRGRIAVLAAEIARNVGIIDQEIESKGLQQPSFDEDAPTDISEELSITGRQAHVATLEATSELYDLLLSHREMFQSQRWPWFPYEVMERFNIHNLVPMGGEVSYDELATATGVNESALRHIIRLCITYRVLQERRAGYVSHSAISRQMVEDPFLLDRMNCAKEEIFMPYSSLAEALAMHPSADEPSQSAYLLSKKSDQPTFFDHLAKYPDREARFARSMTHFATTDPVPTHYPWAELGDATVVDLGGSSGTVAFSIASIAPRLHLIVQDLPGVVSNASQQSGMNVEFMAHNFFEPQSVNGADVYMFRWCMHDWPDKYCMRMLLALTPALKPGAHVLIVDAVVPPFGTLPNRAERTLL